MAGWLWKSSVYLTAQLGWGLHGTDEQARIGIQHSGMTKGYLNTSHHYVLALRCARFSRHMPSSTSISDIRHAYVHLAFTYVLVGSSNNVLYKLLMSPHRGQVPFPFLHSVDKMLSVDVFNIVKLFSDPYPRTVDCGCATVHIYFLLQ